MQGDRIDHRQDANRGAPAPGDASPELATFTDLLEYLERKFVRRDPMKALSLDGAIEIASNEAREMGHQQVMNAIRDLITEKGKA